MCKKKESSPFWKLLEDIINAIKQEVVTPFGRVNLIVDIVLAAIVVLVFSADRIERFFIIFLSERTPELLKYLSEAETFHAFLVFAFFSILCVIFMFLLIRAGLFQASNKKHD